MPEQIKLPDSPSLRAALVVGMNLAAHGQADWFDVRKCEQTLLRSLIQEHDGTCRGENFDCMACTAHRAYAAAWAMWEDRATAIAEYGTTHRKFPIYYPSSLDKAASAIAWLEKTCRELQQEPDHD